MCGLHTTHIEGFLKDADPKETSAGPVTQESRKHWDMKPCENGNSKR